MSPRQPPALGSLPPTRRRLLDTIKMSGPADAAGLASTLGLTASAVRQQLSVLERDGMIVFDQVRAGRGRPRHLYRLSEAGDSLYPRAYAELTNELLEYVEESDPSLIDEIFARRRQARIERAQARMSGLGMEERVAELTRILDEDGYVADHARRDDGAFLIWENNCAIFSVALRYGQACGAEIEFIRAVLPQASVERISHMVQGAHRCAYVVTPL